MQEAPKGIHPHHSLIPLAHNLEYQASTASLCNSFDCLPIRRFINSLPFMPFGSLHSPFLGAESHITQAAFYSQCKNLEGNKIHQSSAWFSKSLPHCSSFPVALQLELFDCLLVRIFNPVAFYLDCCGPNLPNPWSLLLVPDKDLHSHLWSLLPLLKQQRAFYKVMYITHVLVRCSLAYNESHRTAQMNLKGFRMQGTVVKIRLGYSQKQG